MSPVCWWVAVDIRYAPAQPSDLTLRSCSMQKVVKENLNIKQTVEAIHKKNCRLATMDSKISESQIYK